jgi:hypothetical protein
MLNFVRIYIYLTHIKTLLHVLIQQISNKIIKKLEDQRKPAKTENEENS